MTYVNNVSKVNNMSIFMNHLKCLLLFLENLKFLFCNIYNDGKPNYKKNYWDKNHYLGSDCNNKQIWNDDKCRCECKELNDKGVCNKGYIWNPSKCKSECGKSWVVGEYLVYENCKCRKNLVDKPVERTSSEECTENIDKVKIAKMALFAYGNECVCYCTICVILAVIALTISIGTGTYFTYKYINQWYLKKMLFMLSLVPVLKQEFNELINGKSQTNRDQKSNLLFLQRHDQSQKFRIKLVKNRQKNITKALIFTILDNYN